MSGQKVCLIVIDGWGISEKTEGNENIKFIVASGMFSKHLSCCS